MSNNVVRFPRPEDRIDVSACVLRDEEAVNAGMILYAMSLHAFVATYPDGFFHPVHNAEGVHTGWCAHQESGTGWGCRRSSLLDVVDHVLQDHPEGGNCGE